MASCATPGAVPKTAQKELALEARTVLEGLEAGKYSGLAASMDGRIFLAERGGWRLRGFIPDAGGRFELSLPSARCLVAGGLVQGFCVVDLVDRQFIRYDQNGGPAFSAGIEGHGAASFWLAPSGESLFLDADAGAVVFRDQGFRETRRWQLRGAGRPQALAADLLEGLVAVAYPGGGRLDTYSVLGSQLDSRPMPLAPGPQTLAFDSRGLLWTAGEDGRASCFLFSGRKWIEAGSAQVPALCALAPGLRNGVLALGGEMVVELKGE